MLEPLNEQPAGQCSAHIGLVAMALAPTFIALRSSRFRSHGIVEEEEPALAAFTTSEMYDEQRGNTERLVRKHLRGWDFPINVDQTWPLDEGLWWGLR